MSLSLNRRVLLTFMAAVVCFQTFAQSSRYHIVASGETIASIAEQYEISEDVLKKANPTAARVFYVGLRLIIPEAMKNGVHESAPSPGQQDTKASASENADIPPFYANSSKKKEQHQSLLSTTSIDDISLAAGLFFGSDFSKVAGFNYGVFANAYLQNGFGAYLSVSTNALTSSADDSDVIIKIGPGYKRNVTSSVSVGASICYALSFLSNNSMSASISGLNLMPFVGYSFGSFEVSFTLDIYVRNGHKGLRVGPYLGISYLF